MGEALNELSRHDLSAFWGDMPPADFQALVDDISANGQIEPIITLEGQVLDGWHRYRACEQIGRPCLTTELPAGKNPAQWAISRNRMRRHDSGSQRAMAVVKCLQWAPVGRPSGNPEPGSGFPPATEAQAAAAAGVSDRTIRQAKAVAKKAVPEVEKAVRDGKVSVKRAAEVAQLPKRQQVRALGERPAPKAPPDESVTEIMDRMQTDLQRAEATAREMEVAMNAADDKKYTASLVRRLEQAERKRDEAMHDAKQMQAARDFYEKQLARCGKAVGERDLDKVAPRVEALMRTHKVAA